MDHTEQGMNHAEHMAAMNDDVAGAEAILTSYRDALTSRDAEAMAALFAQESFIYENGKAEGSFTHYMEHHLGPELDAITSFTFGELLTVVTILLRTNVGRLGDDRWFFQVRGGAMGSAVMVAAAKFSSSMHEYRWLSAPTRDARLLRRGFTFIDDSLVILMARVADAGLIRRC